MNTTKTEIYGTISGLVLATMIMLLTPMMPLLSPYANATITAVFLSIYTTVVVTAALVGLFTIAVVLEEGVIKLNLHVFTITLSRNLPETPKTIFMKSFMPWIIPPLTIFVVYSATKLGFWYAIQVTSLIGDLIKYVLLYALESLWQAIHQIAFMVIVIMLTGMWILGIYEIRKITKNTN